MSPNAGTSGFSGTTGSPISVEDNNSLFLPVTSSSNAPATWTTNGLSLSGTAYADGPVYAWVYWINGTVDDNGASRRRGLTARARLRSPTAGRRTRWGTCSCSTISELANAVFGVERRRRPPLRRSTTSSTALRVIVSRIRLGRDFFFGPSIFLARSDLAADASGCGVRGGHSGLGCAVDPDELAGPVDPDPDPSPGCGDGVRGRWPVGDQRRGRPTAGGDAAFQCGGTSPRTDLEGHNINLQVIRIFGQTLYDTNAELATFVGAEPPAAFGAFAATNQFNSTAGMSTGRYRPGGPVNTALIVTGENFQDTMVASVPAYGGDFLTDIGQTGPMPLIATATNVVVAAGGGEHLQPAHRSGTRDRWSPGGLGQRDEPVGRAQRVCDPHRRYRQHGDVDPARLVRVCRQVSASAT